MENVQKFAGMWHNQYGSEMNLEVDHHGRIFGKFRTNCGRSETRALWTDVWFDVVGFANGDLISFVVNYGEIGTLSAVSGRFIPKEQSKSGINKIKALGYTSFKLPEQDQWRSTTVTTVVYKPGPAPKNLNANTSQLT